MASDDPRDEIVSRLARDLYEYGERIDPGRYDCKWDDLGDYERAFRKELIYRLLTRRSDLMKLLEESNDGL